MFRPRSASPVGRLTPDGALPLHAGYRLVVHLQNGGGLHGLCGDHGWWHGRARVARVWGSRKALQDAGHPATSIYYVGAQRGIETDLVPRSPYPHTFLDVVGFQRSLSRRNLGFAPKLVKATRQALKLLRRLRPNVVVSVGGYASMPAVLAAKRLRIPVVVVSFDRRPGWASVVSSRFAAACAVAFEGSVLPRAEVTGAPVRRAIRHVDRSGGRDAARRALGIPAERFLLTVIGGSLGSGVLNDGRRPVRRRARR